MKIIELTETQFRNYSKLHSARNYKQTTEYANMQGNKFYYLGYINEKDNTLMGATLLFEDHIGKIKFGYVPGSFLIDYNNDNLFKDFIMSLKTYLKNKKYVYVTTDNISTYKMFGKNDEVIYYDTNIIKLFDDLPLRRIGKVSQKNVVLETEKTPEETFKLFNINTKRNINLSVRRAINIYIYILNKEDKENDRLNELMQNINIKKSNSIVNKKMTSDKKITKYQNEIIKATNVYTKYPKEVIIGGILIIRNNREIYFLEEAYNKDLKAFYSSHLIKWEIIKKYLNQGYKIFNFGPIKSTSKKDGNYTFKMGFGAKVYEYIGTYDLVVNKYIYFIIKFIVKIRELIKRITKK